MAQIADVLAEVLSSYGLTPARNRTTEIAGRTHTFHLVVRKKSQEIFVHVDDSGTPADGRKLDAHWQAVRAAGGQHGIYISKAGFDEEGARAAAGCGLVLWGPEELERVVGRAILRDALPLGRSVQDILSVTYHPPLADARPPPAPVATAAEPAAAGPLPSAPPVASLASAASAPPAPPALPPPRAEPVERVAPEALEDGLGLLPTLPLELLDAPEAVPSPAPAKPVVPAAPAPPVPDPPTATRPEAKLSTPGAAPPLALDAFFAGPPRPAVPPAEGLPAALTLPSPPRTGPALPLPTAPPAPPAELSLPAPPANPAGSPAAGAPSPPSAATPAAGPLLWDLPSEGPAHAPEAPAATVTHFGLDVIPVGTSEAIPPPASDAFEERAAATRESGDPFSRLAARLERERWMERFAPPGPAPPATAWPEPPVAVPSVDDWRAATVSGAPPGARGLLPPSGAGGPLPGLPASPPGPATPAPRFDAASGTVIYAAPRRPRAPTAPPLGGAGSDGRARPPVAAPASPKPLDDVALEWAPETGTILRPAVTRELATTIARDRIFVVDTVSMRLHPRHVYEYSVDVTVDGKLGRHRVSGVKTVDATTGAVGQRRSWGDPATVERLAAQAPVAAAQVLLTEAKAREKAVDAVIEETARAVTVEDVDNRSDFYMVTRRHVRIARQDVALAPKGLHWHPVWSLSGMNGSIEIDALTGEILELVNHNRGTNVIEL